MATMMSTNAAGLNLGSLQRCHLNRTATLPQRVRCQAGSNEPKDSAKQVSTKLLDVFAFSGSAPETINGRLAMLGFVSAIGVELASGRDLVSQINGGGGAWFGLSAVVITVASLVPMLNGISVQSRSQAVMSSKAEMLNGRFAMLGLLALAVTEYVSGGPLV